MKTFTLNFTFLMIISLFLVLYIGSFRINTSGELLSINKGTVIIYYYGLPIPFLAEHVENIPVMQNVSVLGDWQLQEAWISVHDQVFTPMFLVLDWLIFLLIILFIDLLCLFIFSRAPEKIEKQAETKEQERDKLGH